MNKQRFSIISLLLIIVLVIASVFASPVRSAYASDYPSDYNCKMVKAYGDYGYASTLSLYQMMMATYGANTYKQYYKSSGSGGNNWKFTYYWRSPASGASTRRWSSMSEMEAAGVLPQAGDIIIFCNGTDLGRNYNGDPVSLTHSGIVVTDPSSSGVFYTIEGCYANTGAVVRNKRSIYNTYTMFSRLDNNPDYMYYGHYKLYAIIHNESAEVRNYMVQTAYSEKKKYDSLPSAYVNQIHRDMSYNGYWCVGFVARVALENPTVGYLKLKATTSYSNVPGSLFEGAQYRVYRDADCTLRAGPYSAVTLKIGKDGLSSKTLPLAPGTYYIKQVSAPSSGLFYSNSAVTKITISKNKTVELSGGILYMTPKSDSALRDAVTDMISDNGTPFWDVPSDHPYAAAILWADSKGVARGYSDELTGCFGVNDPVTRGQVAMMLWRAAGKPSPSGNTQTFADVPVTHNFYKAIQWAYENNIAAGYSGSKEGYFGPNDKCTRGQIVTFIWRAAGKPKTSLTTQKFSDVPEDHSYFKAVQWAYQAKLTSGFSDGTFRVSDKCTRGQCVFFLYRWFGNK